MNKCEKEYYLNCDLIKYKKVLSHMLLDMLSEVKSNLGDKTVNDLPEQENAVVQKESEYVDISLQIKVLQEENKESN
jgi:hypothetical protein